MTDEPRPVDEEQEVVEAPEAEQEPAPAPDDAYLRLAADFDNYRKRVAREHADLTTRANERLLNELLPVLDDLERALEAAAEHEEAKLEEGVKLVHRSLVALLQRHGLSEIATEGAFDPLVAFAADGAVLLKWLPSVQGIDPADPRHRPFYRRLAELRLPLLSHTGAEESFTGADNALADPERLRLPLEEGVTVIAAHCAANGTSAGEPNSARSGTNDAASAQ